MPPGQPLRVILPAPEPPPAPPSTLPEPVVDPYFSAAPVVLKSKGKGSLGLDAAAFLPITREEIKDAARGTNLLANLWFGRRDLIPPADDPRTKLIDRALVTHGLLSPEQLIAINDVGALMDRVRPAFAAVEHQASLTGSAAVSADREARAARKP